MLGYIATSLEIGDLPILPENMRATTIFARMKTAIRNVKLQGRWNPKTGSVWELAYCLLCVNGLAFIIVIALAAVRACLTYAPVFFLQRLVSYLETDPERKDPEWGWFYCVGLFSTTIIGHLSRSHISWSISNSQNLIWCLSCRSTLVSFCNHLTGTITCPAQFNFVRNDLGAQRYRIFLWDNFGCESRGW